MSIVLWLILLCGIAGGLFGRFLYKGTTIIAPMAWCGWIRRYPVLLAMILGLVIAAIGTVYQGQTYGTGYHEASAALRGTYEAPPGVFVAKWAATVMAYWAGIPGGIFTPSLTVGAMLGQQIGQIAQLEIGANMLVLICMAGFLAAATQSPLISSVIVMEMTGGQNLLFWLLIGTIFASQVSRQFSPKPFYHAACMRFRQRVQEDYAAQQAKNDAGNQPIKNKEN